MNYQENQLPRKKEKDVNGENVFRTALWSGRSISATMYLTSQQAKTNISESNNTCYSLTSPKTISLCSLPFSACFERITTRKFMYIENSPSILPHQRQPINKESKTLFVMSKGKCNMPKFLDIHFEISHNSRDFPYFGAKKKTPLRSWHQCIGASVGCYLDPHRKQKKRNTQEQLPQYTIRCTSHRFPGDFNPE